MSRTSWPNQRSRDIDLFGLLNIACPTWFVCQRPRHTPYKYGYMADWKPPTNRSINTIYLFFLRTVFLYRFLRYALAALGFGSSLPFCAEKRPYLLSEIEDPLLLCRKSNRSSSRKYDGYPSVARQFCVPTRFWAKLVTRPGGLDALSREAPAKEDKACWYGSEWFLLFVVVYARWL
jgi:hypothetical protein